MERDLRMKCSKIVSIFITNVKSALPQNFAHIVDPNIVHKEEEEEYNNRGGKEAVEVDFVQKNFD